MITTDLLQTILNQYALPWNGYHGVSHWARVLENGRRLIETTGAKIEVVQLFAVLHDSKRKGEGFDHNHGRRGADFAASLRGTLIYLSAEDFDLLYEACAYHTDGLTEGDITLQTCWDADRLDLGRVRIPLNPNRLCTAAAKEPGFIQWADGRGRSRFIPELVQQEWNLSLDGSKKNRNTLNA